MPKGKIAGKKGIVLFIVLATLMVVIILANVMLNIMLSQSRLTHHQVSRIQGYYAAWAGVNLAYDGLYRRDAFWPFPVTTPGLTYNRVICRAVSASIGNPCSNPQAIIDASLPNSIHYVNIDVTDRTHPSGSCNPPVGTNICINATTNYTFQ